MSGDLHSDDAMEVYLACQAVTASNTVHPGQYERLLELLDDEQDADCGQLTCVAAVDALARIDPSGRWMHPAGRSFRSHIERDNHDQARGIAAAVRRCTTVSAYLTWCWQSLPDRIESIGGRAAAAANWLANWETDHDLVAALVAVDEASHLWVLRQLLMREVILDHLLRTEPQARAATTQWVHERAALTRWTATAPASLKDEVRARAQTLGLLP